MVFLCCCQGGKFDHADRLFQGVEGTYRNCLTNTSDVKELIPEFFYMPEFLVNSNSYHLGVKQDGEPIGDVCLPPWAKVHQLYAKQSSILEQCWWQLLIYDLLLNHFI